MKNKKSAFTMIELVFVVVIIGILAAVAIPRLAATRDDAEITKARVLVASVRNALAMERQKRVLRGKFNKITAVGDATNVFGNFYVDISGTSTITTESVLEYPMASSTDKGRWSYSAGEYKFNHGAAGNPIFVVTNGKFVCKTAGTCDALLD